VALSLLGHYRDLKKWTKAWQDGGNVIQIGLREKEGIKDLSENNAFCSGRDTLATSIFQC
jgi:hypothetical protein